MWQKFIVIIKYEISANFALKLGLVALLAITVLVVVNVDLTQKRNKLESHSIITLNR